MAYELMVVNAELRKFKADYKTSLKKLTGAYGKIQQLEKELEEALNDSKAKNQEMEQLKDEEVNSLKQIINELEQNSEMKSQEIESLKQSVTLKEEDGDILRQELQKKDRVIESMAKVIDQIIEAKPKNTEDLKEKSVTEDSKVLDLPAKNESIQDLEFSDVSDLHQEIGKLYMKLQNSENQQNNRVLDLEDEIENLEGTLKTRDQELERMDSKYKEKEAEHWKCIEERQTLLLKIKQLEEKVHVASGHVTDDNVTSGHAASGHMASDHMASDHMGGDHMGGDHMGGDHWLMNETFRIFENLGLMRQSFQNN